MAVLSHLPVLWVQGWDGKGPRSSGRDVTEDVADRSYFASAAFTLEMT